MVLPRSPLKESHILTRNTSCQEQYFSESRKSPFGFYIFQCNGNIGLAERASNNITFLDGVKVWHPPLPFWSIFLNISIFEAASSCFAKENPGPTSPLPTSGQSSHWRLGEGFAWKGLICQTIQFVFSLLFTWLSRFFLSSQLSYSVTQSPKNTNSQCSYILERKIMK